MKIPKDIKFPAIIGTGCGRSGTAFLAKLLTQGGIPMGHEAYFGMPGFGEWREGMIGDVSWLSVPHLKREKKRGAKIIQIVRHPLKHISSMMHVHTLEDHNFKANIYTIYKELFLPTLRRVRLKDRYILYWITWNRMAERHADLLYRLEDLVDNPKDIFDDLGVDVEGVKFNTKKTNNYSGVKQHDWKDFRDCLYYDNLLDAAYHYKYLTEKQLVDLKKLKENKLNTKM